MPKYYCDYCKSYLTHDTMSVRKSHLMGKHHIKYYCDYYEFKAKETGEWNPQELIYEITFDKLNRGIPGGSDRDSNNNHSPDRRGDKDAMDTDMKRAADEGREKSEGEGEEEGFTLPPPPHMTGLPPPPPAVYNNTRETQIAIRRNIHEQ
ncbi:hypothetical protein CANMA_001512 [Candida margitis]|uniref:uncharacterized protein n=1 Tax=Candida margitis TaxID=1775924 RepID=UPI002228039B|nr:uncharacterized protein CANMA_001512 [Candida margitis]KAI5969444.1 hypothetical protein CANMA_001512 [Candida margitis]